MSLWTAFPYPGAYVFDAASTALGWTRLHRSDSEPLPTDTSLLAAWALFHNGEFQKAAAAGLALGGAGLTLANQSTCIYATYLEPFERMRLDLFLEVAARAEAQAQEDPQNANAWYWHAYALGRYSQGISVAKALAQGLGGKVKESLERAIRLEPRHAGAHIALGAFHAEVIDKVGALIGSMTYGVRKDVGLKLLQEALNLTPGAAIAMVEYANALLMLDGEQHLAEATRLYEQAATAAPVDAMEHLDADLARSELDG
jgi:tetratricopeptide (TPR) repeat protein